MPVNDHMHGYCDIEYAWWDGPPLLFFLYDTRDDMLGIYWVTHIRHILDMGSPGDHPFEVEEEDVIKERWFNTIDEATWRRLLADPASVVLQTVL